MKREQDRKGILYSNTADKLSLSTKSVYSTVTFTKVVFIQLTAETQFGLFIKVS